MDLQIYKYTELSLLLFAQLDVEWTVGLPVVDGGGGIEEKQWEVAGERLCGFVMLVIFKFNKIIVTDKWFSGKMKEKMIDSLVFSLYF